MSRLVLGAVLLTVACASRAAGQDPGGVPGRRGPLVSREEWLPTLPLLTLPAVSPDALPRGRSELRLDLDWGNDFGWEAVPGGGPENVQFMFDGEHTSAILGLRHGVSSSMTVGVRLPVRWQGAGLLDDVIDPFHRLFGFPDGGRPLFPANRFHVEARRADGRVVPVQISPGTGLGAAEAEALWALHRRGPGPGSALALVGRVLLPTGTGPFARRTVDTGVQIAASRSLGTRVDVYTGLGLARFGDVATLGFTHRRTRPHGFLALEWRPFRRASLLAQGELASRLITEVPLPGAHAYLRLGTRFYLRPDLTLDAGFSEGVHALEATTDFAVHAGLSRRF